ncbi:hypothetical protein Pen01_17840 [Phytomonospora endophytica]|nr:hypothetical protein Pen01_17840 [Phytomonospora endophytica]
MEATGIAGSTRTIQRLESGQSISLTFPAIGRLAEYYGAPPELCKELEEMFKAADRPWGDSYTDSMIKGFSLFIELEQTASELLIYEPNLVTGLLQTEAYSTELYRRHEIGEVEIRRSLEIMERRQRAFWDRTPVPALKVLMGEWALREADPTQLERLREATAEIRVLPIGGGPHPFLRGPFTLLRFSGEEPDCVYEEGPDGSRYEEKPATAEIYHRVFTRSWDRGRPIEEF